MIGFDPMHLQRLVWTVRGWWHFDPPTAAGYPIEQELDVLLPESALIVAFTIFFLCAAPAFLRRTRPDVKPWRIRDDHPLREDEHWLKHTLATREDDGTVRLDYKPVEMGPYIPMERKY